MSDRSSWDDIRNRRSPVAQRAYEDEARISEFRELVYRLRTEAGLTQAELAGRMGTTQSAIARIEGGESRPSLETLEPGGVERARLVVVYTIHAAKKLLDRVKQPVEAPVTEPSTLLGNWYATVLFWKPQVALVVNERTLVPVLMPLARAATLAERVPDHVGRVLEALGTPIDFVLQEVAAMAEASYAKTANRSIVGSMNEFSFLANVHREHGEADDLVALSVKLAGTPCGPLYKSHSFPDRELAALVAEQFGDDAPD